MSYSRLPQKLTRIYLSRLTPIVYAFRDLYVKDPCGFQVFQFLVNILYSVYVFRFWVTINNWVNSGWVGGTINSIWDPTYSRGWVENNILRILSHFTPFIWSQTNLLKNPVFMSSHYRALSTVRNHMCLSGSIKCLWDSFEYLWFFMNFPFFYIGLLYDLRL